MSVELAFFCLKPNWHLDLKRKLCWCGSFEVHKACYNTTHLLPLLHDEQRCIALAQNYAILPPQISALYKSTVMHNEAKVWIIASHTGEMMQPPGLGYLHHISAQSAGKSRGGTSKNINHPNFGQVRKHISFRELWRRIKFLSTTFAFSASNCGALGAAEKNTKAFDFSPHFRQSSILALMRPFCVIY